MDYRRGWILGAGLTGLLLAACWTLPGMPFQARAAEKLDYETSCESSTPGSYDGYVLNKSGDNYKVDGMVTFNFSIGGTDNQRTILVAGHALVGPRQRVLVASTAAPFLLAPGVYCRFDVSEAIRKQP